MRFDQVLPRPPGWWAPRQRPGAATMASDSTAMPGAEALEAQARHNERRITFATGAAWLAFVLAGVLVAGFGAGSGAAGRLGFAAVAGLLATGPALTNPPPQLSRRALAIGFVCCLLAWPIMALVDNGNDKGIVEDDDPPMWQMVMMALALGAAYLVMFHRSLRGQVLPVFVIVVATMLMILLPIGYLERHVGACFTEPSTPEGSSSLILFNVMGLSLGLLGVWLGFKALGGLVRLIERGWISELSMGSIVSLSTATPDAEGRRRCRPLVYPALESGSRHAGVRNLTQRRARQAGTTGPPSRITSMTTATRLNVILLKSMCALRIGLEMGTVFSRISTIFTISSMGS